MIITTGSCTFQKCENLLCYHRNCAQNRDIISALILKPFSARNFTEQKLIYEQNRPLPKLGFQCGGRKFRLNGMERNIGFVSMKVSRAFSVVHVSFLGLGSLLHGQSQAIRICNVSSLIVKGTRLLSRTFERIKRGKPSIYLSLRGLTYYFRERGGKRSSITTRRL